MTLFKVTINRTGADFADGEHECDISFTTDELSWALAYAISATGESRLCELMANVVCHLVDSESIESFRGNDNVIDNFIQSASELSKWWNEFDKARGEADER